MAPKKSKSTKEDETNDDQLWFSKRIRDLTNSLKLDCILMPSNNIVAKATLGPTFKQHFPDELAPYYSLANGETLLINQPRLNWTN